MKSKIIESPLYLTFKHSQTSDALTLKNLETPQRPLPVNTPTLEHPHPWKPLPLNTKTRVNSERKFIFLNHSRVILSSPLLYSTFDALHFEQKKILKNHNFSSKIKFDAQKGWYFLDPTRSGLKIVKNWSKLKIPGLYFVQKSLLTGNRAIP